MEQERNATPRPFFFLTVEEREELIEKVSKAYALADVFNISFHNENGGPEPENLEAISSMIFDFLVRIKELVDAGMGRELEPLQAQGGVS